MLKKVLIGVGVSAVIAVVAFGFLTHKVMNAVEEKVPEFKQYVNMTVEEQNLYAQKNMGELLQMFGNAKTDEFLNKTRNNPEIANAEIQMVRAVIARFIIGTEEIAKDLTAEQKAQFQIESDEFNTRSEIYNKLIEKFKADNQN